MPWREVTKMSLREEYVQLAMQVGSNRRELCRRFGTHSGPE
jgi:transposase-like protein